MFLGVERVAGNQQALQRGGGFCFFLTEAGEHGRCVRLCCRCGGNRLGQFCDQRLDSVELFGGGFAL